MRRNRNAKIVATLGPASSTESEIENLFKAGADVFRLNFSHGTHETHAESVRIIRTLEQRYKRPIGIIMDVQGPKLRIGAFVDGKITLQVGHLFRLDLERHPGNSQRVCMPHPEIFKALKINTELLLDDGKIRLKVINCDDTFAETKVISGGELSNRKGVNVPGVSLPISALTEKDRQDLAFGLSLSVDWVALSFVQKPEDILEARALINGRAKLAAKLEKPLAIEHLEEIVDLSDGIMVARGDLGVEMPPEDVPAVQKCIIRSCRKRGKPVIVATQMLDSMVHTPYPTRAEASDVATAIYDGVDAVMLSAESASGQYPVQAVDMMDRIITRTEQDETYRQMLNDTRTPPLQTVDDAISAAAWQVAQTLPIASIVTFTESGATALRVARERPACPIVALTPNLNTARFLMVVWGVNTRQTDEMFSFSQMVEIGCQAARDENFAQTGEHVIVTAGIPFGKTGSTNILRVAQIA